MVAGCGGDEEDGGEGSAQRFDSQRAFESILMQVEGGPRPAGSPASRELAEHLKGALPDGAIERVPGGLQNVVGTLPGSAPAIVVAAHYDTEATVPGHVGANDGAAGTAAVVELASALERELPDEHREVRFVLFDGEEEPPGCPDASFEQCALRGSKAYVEAHPGEVGELILLDYVANAGLQLPREANSDPELWRRLREAAAAVGAERFFPTGATASCDRRRPHPLRPGRCPFDRPDRLRLRVRRHRAGHPRQARPRGAGRGGGDRRGAGRLQLAAEPAQP